MREMLRQALGLLLFLLMGVAPVLAEVHNLSPGEAQKLLQETPGVFLLDVRTPGEYQRARLQGARLIPIDQVSNRLAEIPTGTPILVYCAVGSRSSQVSRYLEEQGLGPIYNLYGGIWGWQLGGYPVLAGGP